MIDLSCSVCLGGKFVGDIVITHVTEPETRRGLGGRGDVVEACPRWRRGGVDAAEARDRVGCFCPRKLLSLFFPARLL